MPELVKCGWCNASPKKHRSIWDQGNAKAVCPGCGAEGPRYDEDGTKWNAMQEWIARGRTGVAPTDGRWVAIEPNQKARIFSTPGAAKSCLEKVLAAAPRALWSPGAMVSACWGYLDVYQRISMLATTHDHLEARIVDVAQKVPCSPPDACERNGRCWAHSEEA